MTVKPDVESTLVRVAPFHRRSNDCAANYLLALCVCVCLCVLFITAFLPDVISLRPFVFLAFSFLPVLTVRKMRGGRCSRLLDFRRRRCPPPNPRLADSVPVFVYILRSWSIVSATYIARAQSDKLKRDFRPKQDKIQINEQ